ncbi:MAG: aldehyde dehydrogenase family protein [Candidatus Omnitrophica bacterium]|nr:aldehyde dehydrogenase family protein [Candidatus Omnitrophota bacterium]
MKSYPLYIDGKFIETKITKDIINPSNSEVIAKVNLATKKEIEMAISSARRSFDNGEWQSLSFSKRKEFILKISQGILENAQELANLETQNVGKPIKETTFMDIPSAAQTFEFFANNFESFLKEETIEIKTQIASCKAKISRQPQGVVVLIVPFNYPLLIASWKMAQALAAGNSVILKPSSLTPLTALELANIIDKIGLPAGVVNIIVGEGESIGEKLCSDRRVDMISFTGSNNTGKKILSYASQNIKKTIMELGGKSASIVLADCDLETAVNGSLCSIFLNQGQMCTAMSRIFVDKKIYQDFVKDFVNKAKKIKLGDPLDFQTQMGPLISKEHREKVLDYIEEAKKEKIELACGGNISTESKLSNGFFFEPTVFVNVPVDSKIFKEEIFAPVVCINSFSNLDEVIKLANSTNFALAASIWTKNEKLAEDLVKKINAGIIWINTYGMFFNQLPYGGFKQSGFGKELGKEGFLEYTIAKSVIIQETEANKPLVNYWYGF